MLLVSGCSGPQRARVNSPLDAAPPPAPLTRSLTVIAYADPRWQLLVNHRERIGDRIDAASDQLLAHVGMRLDLREVRAWPTPVADLRAGLDALQAADLAPEADLVMLFTARPVDGRATVDRLEASRYMGRYVVVRSLTPYLDGDPVWLQAGEVLLIERAVARIHGAMPVCGMAMMGDGSGMLSRRMRAWRWHPRSLALVRAHAKLDLKRRRLSAKAAGQVLEALAATGGCDRAAIEVRRGVLESLATRVEPQVNTSAVVLAGERLLEAGNAVAAFERCAPIAERDPDRAARCAGMAAIALDDPDSAIRYLRAHMAHNPNDETVVLALARAVGRDGDDGAARSLLALYVAHNPEHLQARVNLGVAMARLGDYPGAKAQWTQVLARDPDHPAATKLLAQMP
ncbi:MAG: thioredoxin-like negative regulator of GroEL [Bradymonadia bacterium]|jgi:thioredoxin-like negative regulator of GroEL